jgi:formylglycine-generating enzyme required for sulfatase activity/tRNA A-37 threonylcarbamoyl transferase component Bud32
MSSPLDENLLITSRVLRIWLPEIPERPLLDTYRLIGVTLGSGGFGTVEVGCKKHLEQKVAIKRIHADRQFSESDQRRFVREVRLLAPLQAPNIVRIEDWGRDEQGLYIVMELIDGPNLNDLVRQNGLLPADQILNFARQICQALLCAHKQGIVHRDLKPANLLLDPYGIIKLADFGLAREAAEDREKLTSSAGVGLYTFAYASPEQLRGDQTLDGRSDLFSLGATLYHLAMGRADTSRVFDPDELPESCSILQPLLSALLRPNRDKRPADVQAVLSILDQLQQGSRQVAGRPATPPESGSDPQPPMPPEPPGTGKGWGPIIEVLQRKVAEQHAKARQLLQQQRYAEAAAALDEIPQDHRHLVDQQLYQQCVSQRDQVQTLEREIDAAVKSLRFEGLREKVEQLQRLQPWRQDVAEVLKSLPKTPPAPPAPAKPRLLVAPFDLAAAKAAQAALAKQLQQPEEWTNTIGMKFRLIPAGTFLMGSPEGKGRDNERPQHKVTITRAFRLAIHTVTQSQWQQVMGTTPWKGQGWVKEGSDIAATYVSWDDAVAFCKRLSEREGRRYRLPTEAEWEWCCRAGTTTEYSFGDDESSLSEYAWFDGNAYYKDQTYAHAVRQKKPNPFGLYDMHGNVWEWCEDWFDDEYYSSSPGIDPTGPSSGSSRVSRGGSWIDEPDAVRCAKRVLSTPVRRGYDNGFRILLE